MAIDLGLNANGQAAFHDLLQTHHRIDVRLQLMDLNHTSIGEELSARLLDGQVTVDAGAEVTRGLDMDLLDPTGALHLDSKSPDDGALFADRMIQVKYAIINPMETVRYTTPVFTGPLTKLERTGAIVKAEAQGKEIFGLSTAWNEKTFKKGATIVSAIRYILVNMMGEAPSRVRLPSSKAKLPRNVSVGGDKLPWAVAKQLAASIGYQLFYDGLGICRMRKRPSGVSFTFVEGRSIKTEPDVGFSIDDVVNAVEVLGKKPKKKKGKTTKKRPHARLVADRQHPLSPWALGRVGGPRYLPVVIEDDNVDNDAEAKARAKRELASGLLQSVEVAYDTLVIPHLEEMDVVRCNTTKFAGNHRLMEFAIPLTAGGDMSVGYVRNVRPKGKSRAAAQKRKKTRKKRRRA
jgi:hypothetical protein